MLISHLASERRTGNPAPALAIVAAEPLARKPDSVDAEIWLDFLSALMRRSGLLDSRAGDFVFLHRTLMDYLVARHRSDRARVIRNILSIRESRRHAYWSPPREDPSFISFILDPGTGDPRSGSAGKPASEITESEIESLLMRLVANSKVDASGFLGDQIRMGTRIPDRARAELAEKLRSTAKAATSASITAARVLADIDYYEGMTLLESLALDKGMHWRRHAGIPAINAAGEVMMLDRSRGTQLLRDMAAVTYHSHCKVMAASMLAQIDPASGTELLKTQARSSRLREDRIEAAKCLAKYDPEASTELLTSLARDGYDSSDRAEAARALTQIDRERGIKLLEAAARSAISEATRHRESYDDVRYSREERRDFGIKPWEDTARQHRKFLRDNAAAAMQVLAEVDKDRATNLLEQFTADLDMPSRDRAWISGIIASAGEGQLDRHAASSDLDDVDPRWLRAQLQKLEIAAWREAIRKEPLAADSDIAPGRDPVPAGLLPSLQHHAAAGVLRAIALSKKYSSGARLGAAVQLAKLHDLQAPDLLAALARDASCEALDQHRAIEVLARLDGQRVVSLLRTIGQTADYPSRDRLRAVIRLAELGDQQAPELLEEFIRDTGNEAGYRHRAMRMLAETDLDRASNSIDAFIKDKFFDHLSAIIEMAEFDPDEAERRLQVERSNLPVWRPDQRLAVHAARMLLRRQAASRPSDPGHV